MIFGQIFGGLFGQMFGHAFGRIFLGQNIHVQFYWGGEIQCTVVPGQGKQPVYYLQFQIQKILSCILGML